MRKAKDTEHRGHLGQLRVNAVAAAGDVSKLLHRRGKRLRCSEQQVDMVMRVLKQQERGHGAVRDQQDRDMVL